MGPLPGATITLRTLRVTNPFDAPATITEILAIAPFLVRPDALPASIGPSGSVDLPLQCVPIAPGPQATIVALEFASGAQRATREFEVRGTFEAVAWTVAPPTLDYGVVPVGATAERSLELTNLSTMSPVTLTGAQVPDGGFTIDPWPFPATVGPGQRIALVVRYAPTEVDVHDGTLVVGPTDVGGALQVPVAAGEPPDPELVGESVIDLGPLTFTAGLSQAVEVDVPADAVGVMFEARGATTDLFALEVLTGPPGTAFTPPVYETGVMVKQGSEIHATTIPYTDATQAQPMPGRYTVRWRLAAGDGTTARARVVLERRATPTTEAWLDLNVWLAQGLTPTAATAPNDPRLTAIFARAAAILAAQGIIVGDLDWYDLTDPSFDRVQDSELAGLYARTGLATRVRANVVCVMGFDGILAGIAGLSARVGAPRANGTQGSGLVVDVASFADTDFVGGAVAHELCHALGLFHDIEQDGTPDYVSDTTGAPNLMDPILTAWGLTPGQALVLRGHPHLRPPPPSAAKRRLPAATEPPRTLAPAPAEGWCWHCRPGRAR
jgi:hypothetical protein